MKNFHRYLTPLGFIVAFAILFSFPAEAQFLNKLTKGIEKVKKTVEKVDKTLNDNKPKNQSKSQTSSSTTSKPSQPAPSSVQENNESFLNEDNDDQEEAAGDKLMKEMLKNVGFPYITMDTKYIVVPSAGNLPSITNAFEGIFGVSMQKKVLGENLYGFWTTDGKKLFDAEWETLTHQNNYPEFNGGVVPMRKTRGDSYKNQPIYLLYSDGRSKAIPSSETWFSMTNFKDGLAIGFGPIGKGECFYVNTAGEKVFPHIVMKGMPLYGIRPLRDGLRSFCIGTEKCGYIDSSGKIIFPPKFKEAGDFSEGYAWVVTEDNVKQLIDKTGKTIFKLDDRNSKTSEVVNGIFYVSNSLNSYMDYYDITGKKLLTVESGNQFYDGLGYVYIPQHNIDLTTPISIVNKDMKVVRYIPTELIDWSEIEVHKPVFNSNGLATVFSALIGRGSSVIRPNGDIVLYRYDNVKEGTSCNNFSPVSDAGYVKADIVYNDASGREIKGGAIMKTTGEIVCIISDSKFGNGPLTTNSLHFPTKDFPDNNQEVILKTI